MAPKKPKATATKGKARPAKSGFESPPAPPDKVARRSPTPPGRELAAEGHAAGSAEGDAAGGTDKADYSKMIGHLKYHAREGNKDDKDKAGAQTTLDRYKQLPKEQKPSFLQLFLQNKHSKDWKWAHEFTEKEEHVESVSSSTIVHFWNRHQIFAAEGFGNVAMDEDGACQLLNDILADNRAKHGHSAEMEPSPSGNPLLTKYKYVEDKGDKTTKQDNTISVHDAQVDCKQKEVSAAVKVPTSSTPVVSIKTEDDGNLRREFNEQLGVLTSAKTALEKVIPPCEDLALELGVSNDAACRARARDVQEAGERMRCHLHEVRNCVLTNKALDKSAADLGERVQFMKELQKVAMMHLDGFKTLKKRCAAMVWV